MLFRAFSSWPVLHPDGKFGRDHKRKVRLTSQQYFQQRILNKDERFAKTHGYVFGAMSHVEAARLRSNANMSGKRGKKTKEGGEDSMKQRAYNFAAASIGMLDIRGMEKLKCL